MTSLRRRFTSIATASILVAAVAVLIPAGSVAAAGGYTCAGGSIPAGSYSHVKVTGPCTVDAGNVTVAHKLVVAHSAALIAAFGGSTLRVGGSLVVRTDGVLMLGCQPETFPCFDDPSLASHHWIGGDLLARHALAIIVHHSRVAHNIYQLAGGGGVNCDSQDILQGSPAYATYEDSKIGGNLTIAGWRSCWQGMFRNTIGGSVTFVDNVTADPDGNEIQTNTIAGDLVCVRNHPAPQQGDSGGSPNVVGGYALNQCAGLV